MNNKDDDEVDDIYTPQPLKKKDFLALGEYLGLEVPNALKPATNEDPLNPRNGIFDDLYGDFLETPPNSPKELNKIKKELGEIKKGILQCEIMLKEIAAENKSLSEKGNKRPREPPNEKRSSTLNHKEKKKEKTYK
jgi:hypothetical protein